MRMAKVFINCIEKGESQLQDFTKKLLGIFRYLEETAQLSFERCVKGDEFRSLMSLITPLISISKLHLGTSSSCRELHRYLVKLMRDFTQEFQQLKMNLRDNPKEYEILQNLWDNVMNYNERTMIIEENNQRFGRAIGFLNVNVSSLKCTSSILANALQQLKMLDSPEDTHLLWLIFQILTKSTIDDQSPCRQENLNILVWRKPDGTIDLLSILRLLPLCLQQYQHSNGLDVDPVWVLQPIEAIRLAWIMDASSRKCPDFIMQTIPSLVVENKHLTDLDQYQNRSVFWMKILRELAPKLGLPKKTIESIPQLLTALLLKDFVYRLTASRVTHHKNIYEDVEPFIDNDDPHDEREIERWYTINLRTNGSTVRPRHLSKTDFSGLPNNAIQLYKPVTLTDVEILRNQIAQSENNTYSSLQIDLHILTIQSRLKQIPHVNWIMTQRIKKTVTVARNICQGASLPTEAVVIYITKLTTIEYLISRSDNQFVIGVLHGIIKDSQAPSHLMATYTDKLKLLINCGEENSRENKSPQITPFRHLDKPVVREYLNDQYKKLTWLLRSISARPQFQSLHTLLQNIKETATDNVITFKDDSF